MLAQHFLNIICLIIALKVQLKQGAIAHKTDTPENTTSEDANQLFERITDTHSSRSWRLPNATYPLRYHVHINTQIHRHIYAYSGNCTVDIVALNNTREIVLHALGLQITAISIYDVEAQASLEHVVHSQVGDLLIISARGQSDANEALIIQQNKHLRVTILYNGIIRDGVFGLYKLFYEGNNNETLIGAVTQFGPFYARTVMPCYDEPSIKAQFTLSITHGHNYTAISNMPQDGAIKEHASNMVTTTFQQTPLMSTYLLGFVICSYKNISAQHGTIQHRVFLPPFSKLDAQIVLQNSVLMLEAFSQYVQVPYALPKLDHIPVSQTDGAAMENWGLITYKQDIFYTPKTNDKWKKFRLTYTIAHEIVHQWLGNLVSPLWWNHLWIKEGLASYYSYMLVDMVSPEQNAMTFFSDIICSEGYAQLTLSRSDSSKAPAYVEKPADIKNSFNDFAYKRAPCIFYMFDHALKYGTFQRGISNFLKKFAFASVSENDLYDALQAAAIEVYSEHNRTWNYDMSSIFKSWIHSSDSPVEVTITRDYNASTISMQQKSTGDNSTQLWWIPLTIITKSHNNTHIDCHMPPVAERTLRLNELPIALAPDDWFLANTLGIALYRVKYDAENLRRVGVALRQDHTVIPKALRARLLTNVLEDITQPTNDVLIALDLLRYLPKEEDPFVWDALAKQLIRLYFVFEKTKAENPFQQFARKLIFPFYVEYRYKLLPESEDSLNIEISLEDLTKVACLMDLPECLADAKQYILASTIKDALPNNMYRKEIILCKAVRNFNNAEFMRALNFYGERNLPFWNLSCIKSKHQKLTLLRALFDIKLVEGACAAEFNFWLKLILLGEEEPEGTAGQYDQAAAQLVNSTLCDYAKYCKGLRKYAPYLEGLNKHKVFATLELCEARRLKLGGAEEKSYLLEEQEIGAFSEEIHENEENWDAVYEWLQKENGAN